MTFEELREQFEIMIKEEGWTEEDIVRAAYSMYQDGSLNLEELRAMVQALGWEFTEEFEEMSEEDKKTKGVEWDDEYEELGGYDCDKRTR